VPAGPAAPPLGLYVHIPFCETKCPYCDFNTYAAIESLMPSYTRALEREIAGWGAWLGGPALTSIFFGGGTPSYLPTRDLARLLRAIDAAFAVAPGAEVTLEANPRDCERERLRAIRRAGFNRISIGVQSLDDQELRLLGRRHDAAGAIAAVDAARVAGFDNLSLDLMFGLPNQFVASWEHTLAEAVALAPDHVSAYALTLEGGTPMEADVRRGRLAEPDGEIAAEMYRLAIDLLAGAGLAQYEISNWARPGRASRHNLAYWRNEAWLGVGPGAHAHLFDNGMASLGALGANGARFAVVKPPRDYIRAAAAWEPPAAPVTRASLAAVPFLDTVEAVSDATAMGETMMMGLRLNEGVSDAAFAARFGKPIAQAFPEALTECLDYGLLCWVDGSLRLTDRGRMVGNEAFRRFVVEAAMAG